jgi:hypothetical protein
MALRIDQILAILKAALEAFLTGLGQPGLVSIARDPFNVFELLNNGPLNYRVVLHWAGDENISELPFVPLLLHRLEVIFGYNLGLTARPDLALIQSVGSRPPLFEQLDNLRTTLLDLQFSSEQTGAYLEYQRCEPMVTPDGVPLAAYRMSFGLRAVPGQATSTTTIPPTS